MMKEIIKSRWEATPIPEIIYSIDVERPTAVDVFNANTADGI